MYAQNRECLFGAIHHNKWVLNDVEEMLYKIWNDIPNTCPEIVIDEFIVMPNHVHGIIRIVGAPLVGALSAKSRTGGKDPTITGRQGRQKNLTTGQAQDLPLQNWGMLLEYLSRFQRINMQLMFMQTNGLPFPVNYGSAIIMNILFAMKPNWTASVTISSIILHNGISTKTIP